MLYYSKDCVAVTSTVQICVSSADGHLVQGVLPCNSLNLLPGRYSFQNLQTSSCISNAFSFVIRYI